MGIRSAENFFSKHAQNHNRKGPSAARAVIRTGVNGPGSGGANGKESKSETKKFVIGKTVIGGEETV